jgi:hypothetical protein
VVTSDLMFLLEFFTSGLFNASILRLTRLVCVCVCARGGGGGRGS